VIGSGIILMGLAIVIVCLYIATMDLRD